MGGLHGSIKQTNNMYGFTVVELLIVIVVIAILVAISVPLYAGIQERAAAAVVVDSLKKATDKVMEERMFSPAPISSLDGLYTPPEIVAMTYTRTTDPGGIPYYGNLTAPQEGKLFLDICQKLVSQGLGNGPNDFKSGTVGYITSCTVFNVHYIQINGWNGGFEISDPTVTEESLQAYVETGASNNPDHPSYRATLENFFSTLIYTFKSQGGTFPITSFWNNWEDTPALPAPTSVTEPSHGFCIIATSTEYDDISFVTTSRIPTPRIGTTCS